MHHRLIAILVVLCFALSGAGCESLFPTSERKPAKKKKKRERKEFETVMLPLQTGSTLQRRMLVEKRTDDDDDDEPQPKKAKKKESPTPTPKPDPAETPPPTQEATPEPTPERFR